MRYRMRQKLANPLGAVGAWYVFKDEQGQIRYSTAFKPFVLRPAVDMRDAGGHTLLIIRTLSMAKPAIHFEIVRDGERTDVRQHFRDGHQQFTATLSSGESIEATSDWHTKSFTFLRGDRQIGSITGEWYSMTERYEIDVAQGEDDVLVLAFALAIHLANEPAR